MRVCVSSAGLRLPLTDHNFGRDWCQEGREGRCAFPMELSRPPQTLETPPAFAVGSDKGMRIRPRINQRMVLTVLGKILSKAPRIQAHKNVFSLPSTGEWTVEQIAE